MQYTHLGQGRALYCTIFKDYLGALLSNPSHEETVEKSCKQALEAIQNGTDDSQIHNVFEGNFVKEFVGPDGKRLFIDGKGELRLLLYLYDRSFTTFERDIFEAPDISFTGRRDQGHASLQPGTTVTNEALSGWGGGPTMAVLL